MGARNQNMCFRFILDIESIEIQLFQLFFFRYFIEGVLLHNINARIEEGKISYGELLVVFGMAND